MANTYYLCRVPTSGTVIILPEKDYEYMRLHERQLYVPDEEYNLLLLAQGTKKQMKAYYALMNDLKESNNVS